MTQINPLIFIFLGAVVSSISAMVIYLRGEFAYFIFLGVGLISLFYGFFARAQIHLEEKKARRESRRHIENIPKLRGQDKLNEKLRQRHINESHSKINHMKKSNLHHHVKQEKQVAGGSMLKHCSSCHTVWHDTDFYCKKCHSRHFYYMNH